MTDLALLLSLALCGVIPTPPAPITAEVYVGENGPYRFVVDTGAQTSTIAPALAASLGLRPSFRAEIVTVTGSRLAPGLHLDEVRINGVLAPAMEILIDDPVEAARAVRGVQGVLGSNALRGTSFLLSAKAGTMNLGAERPAGAVVRFTESDGRIVLQGRMGPENLSFVLDSGASHIVLFRTPVAMANRPPMEGTLAALDGARQAAATTWTKELVLGDAFRLATKPAAVLGQPGRKVDGLLPVSVFDKVFVDWPRREVVLVR